MAAVDFENSGDVVRCIASILDAECRCAAVVIVLHKREENSFGNNIFAHASVSRTGKTCALRIDIVNHNDT